MRLPRGRAGKPQEARDLVFPVFHHVHELRRDHQRRDQVGEGFRLGALCGALALVDRSVAGDFALEHRPPKRPLTKPPHEGIDARVVIAGFAIGRTRSRDCAKPLRRRTQCCADRNADAIPGIDVLLLDGLIEPPKPT